MSRTETGTIAEDLKLMVGRTEQRRADLARDGELLVTARLIIGQLQEEVARLERENAELRHHLNPEPVTEKVLKYQAPTGDDHEKENNTP